jgi:multiple antibiotic resistance protein
MQVFESILVTLAALLPIVNPLGTAPLFLAMSADLPSHARHHLATVVARNAFILPTAAMLVGSYVLAFFGIPLPVVRVAGGLVLLSAGWRLLHAGETAVAPPSPVADAWQREVASRGFYPLTFPLTIGPGTISIAITLGARGAGRPFSPLSPGTNMFLRLSAFILLCVAVAILWSGIVGLVAPLRS